MERIRTVEAHMDVYNQAGEGLLQPDESSKPVSTKIHPLRAAFILASICVHVLLVLCDTFCRCEGGNKIQLMTC